MPKSSMEQLTLLHRHVRVPVDVAATWAGIDRAPFSEWLCKRPKTIARVGTLPRNLLGAYCTISEACSDLPALSE